MSIRQAVDKHYKDLAQICEVFSYQMDILQSLYIFSSLDTVSREILTAAADHWYYNDLLFFHGALGFNKLHSLEPQSLIQVSKHPRFLRHNHIIELAYDRYNAQGSGLVLRTDYAHAELCIQLDFNCREYYEIGKGTLYMFKFKELEALISVAFQEVHRLLSDKLVEMDIDKDTLSAEMEDMGEVREYIKSTLHAPWRQTVLSVPSVNPYLGAASMSDARGYSKYCKALFEEALVAPGDTAKVMLDKIKTTCSMLELLA